MVVRMVKPPEDDCGRLLRKLLAEVDESLPEDPTRPSGLTAFFLVFFGGALADVRGKVGMF